MMETCGLNDEKQPAPDEVPRAMLRRELTVGAGLNQLDDMAEQLVRHRQASIDAEPPAKQAPTLTQGISLVEATLVLVVGALGNAILRGPSWQHLLAFLVILAALLLGEKNLVPIGRDLVKRSDTVLRRVPLSDVPFSIKTLNLFANSAQVREKGLKILQYVLRGVSYLDVTPWSKHLKALSKSTSIARRFFKFGRWVKHFEDLEEAHEQKDMIMRGLLYFRIAANFGADWAEDVCSLERVGILHSLKLGTLSHEFLLFAEYCQFALALVEILVTGVRARKERQVVTMAEAAGAEPNKMLKQRRKLALVRLELVKYVSDVGKALHDCELSFAHEGVFIGCALFSGVMSTHKNICKIYK